MALTVAGRGIVDHGVEVAQRVDLGRELPGAGDGLDVADHDRLGLAKSLASFISPFGVAGMKYDVVALADEQVGRHEAKAGR